MSEGIGLLKTHWGARCWSALWRCVSNFDWNICEASSYFGPKLFVWNCVVGLGGFFNHSTKWWDCRSVCLSCPDKLTAAGSSSTSSWRDSEQLWLVCLSSFSGLVLFWLRYLKYLKNRINFWCVLEAAMIWETLPPLEEIDSWVKDGKMDVKMLLMVVKTTSEDRDCTFCPPDFFSL